MKLLPRTSSPLFPPSSFGCAPSPCDPLLCHCHRVTEREVRAAIDAKGAASIDEVTRQTGAGGGCTACHCRIQRLLLGLPAQCSGARFDLCGRCGCVSVACRCDEEAA